MSVCEDFKKNSEFNPITKKKIKKNGIVYKKLTKYCKEVEDQKLVEGIHKIQQLHNRYIPDFKYSLRNRLVEIENTYFIVNRPLSRDELLKTDKNIHVEDLLKEALDRGYLCNVLYHKNVKIDKKCEIYKFKGICKSYEKEGFDGNFGDLDDEITEELVINMLQQIMLCIAVLQGQYGIVHRSINKNTIFFKTVDPVGSFRYIIRNREFYVPNIGYMFFLDGFDSCKIYNPKYSNDNFYGTRNSKVMLDNSKEATWGEETVNNSYRIRFKSKYIPVFNNWGKIVGLTPNKTTNNEFCHLDTKPEIDVDLTDMNKFPVWENFGDIADLMYLAANILVYGEDEEEPLWYRKAYEIIKYIGDFTKLGDSYDELIYPDTMIANLFPELRFKTQFVDTYIWP